jgi:hypothetical protein
MRFAMYVPNFGTFVFVHTLVGLTQAFEAAGWDGFFYGITSCLTPTRPTVPSLIRGLP